MTRQRFLFVCVSGALLALAGCDRAATPTGTDSGPTVMGTWAWSGAENCWNFGNTITFSPDPDGNQATVTVHQLGQVALVVEDATVSLTPQPSGATQVLVNYRLADGDHEERYALIGKDQLQLTRSARDGQARVSAAIGKTLIRCSDGDLKASNAMPPPPEVPLTPVPGTE
jgi:hypothetical protein